MLKHLIEQGIEKNLPIDRLERGKFQPRQQFDKSKLHELADSIRASGIFTRLIVRPKSNGCYDIIAGERRWRAAQLAGLQAVPCKIVQCNDEQALQVALIENMARAELNPIEEAHGIQRLINEFNYTQEDIAENLGLSRPKITNLLRLLVLHKDVKQLLLDNKLSESHGKLLAGLPQAEQFAFAREAAIKELSTRDLDKAIKAHKKKKNQSAVKLINADTQNLQRNLSDHFGTVVKIVEKTKGKGTFVIEYNSYDELEGIFERCGYKVEI